MKTNMRFPTISPGLFQDTRSFERIPAFVRKDHGLKLSLRPIPRTTECRPGFGK